MRWLFYLQGSTSWGQSIDRSLEKHASIYEDSTDKGAHWNKRFKNSIPRANSCCAQQRAILTAKRYSRSEIMSQVKRVFDGYRPVRPHLLESIEWF